MLLRKHPYTRYRTLKVISLFTLLDSENAYWNIPIRDEDKDKTGFVAPFGSVRHENMAFGLSGARSTFQRAWVYVTLSVLFT